MERESALLGQDTGWQQVVYKNKKTAHGGGRVDVAVVGKIVNKNTFSFYFTEFPETHGAREMLKAFRYYGDAVEVVIPPKRDKWGKRFGFVRFSDVVEPRVLAIKLDNIIFGATKIHVNIPRFQREWTDSLRQRPDNQERVQPSTVEKKTVELPGVHSTRTQQQSRQQNVQKVWRKKEGGREGVKEKGRQWGVRRNLKSDDGRKDAPKIVYHRKNNLAEVCHNVSEEEIQKFKKMYIGTVKTPGSTYYVREWFYMQGFFSLKITPMGANKVVIEEMEDGVIHHLLAEYKDWFYEKFDDIRGWDPEAVDNERVVWVRCPGIPLHAWNDEFFTSLARNFGEYLGVDEATRTKSAMDVARIRLRSKSYDVFNAVVTANINGSLFHIKLTEEWCGPIQWSDNICHCRKKEESSDGSESEDSNGNEPPLFTAENGWFSNYEDEREDGVKGSDLEEEGEKEFDEDDVIHETIGVINNNQLHNDCKDGDGGLEINEDVGNENGVNGGELKGGMGEYGETCKEAGDIHVKNLNEADGAHNENVDGLVGTNTGGCLNQSDGPGKNDNEEVGGERREVECEYEASPIKTKPKKRLKRVGLEKRKKKEKKKKRKMGEAHLQCHKVNTGEAPLLTQNPNSQEMQHAENRTVLSHSASLPQDGVVCNPVGHFQPCSSASNSNNTFGSHVESIGDSGIAMGNDRFDAKMEKIKATKLWRLAKDNLGVSADDDDDEMFIERLRAMEERAKVVKGKKGKTKGFK